MNDIRTRRGVAVAAILALAAAVRLPGLSSRAFEPDELSTWRDALHMAGPSANGPGALGRPAYYFLQHVVLGVMPGSPLSLRLAPLMFGLLGVWLTWFAGRRLFGETAAIVGGLLVALSPWHQYASGFARYWTLVYVLSITATLWLIEAIDSGRSARYRLAALALTLGALTHPTFLFPMIGVIVAVHVLSSDGRWHLQWPSVAAWTNLWIPFVGVFGGWLLWLKMSGNGGALSNWNGRGLGATLGIFPGMVEWLTPAVVVATAVGLLVLGRGAEGRDRRWAGIASAGLASGCVLLFLAGRRTDVYADYGMAMLPLVYLTVGGVADRLIARLSTAGASAPWAAGAVIAAGAIPGIASNLRDGMRFDFRPLYGYVQEHGPAHLLVGPSIQLQRYYAPQLRFEEMGDGIGYLRQTLERTGGFWIARGWHRGGWVNGDAESLAWVDETCRVVFRSGKRRFDYREYDVDLAWCGSSTP